MDFNENIDRNNCMKRKLPGYGNHLVGIIFILLLLSGICKRANGQVSIYLHDFGTTTISTHPYDVAPGIFDSNLSNSSWSNSTGSWTSYNGYSGEAIAITNSSGTPTITLTFVIDPNFEVEITHFDFWRRRSGTGAPNWSMTINGTAVGSGTNPTTGSFIGLTNVANSISNITNSITVVLTLSGGSSTGTFRLDDFTLYGAVTCITPTADDPADVTACDSYVLPALNVGNYFTGSGGTGTALFAGNTITSSQTIYVYAQTGTMPNCTDENSFLVTIHTTPVADDPADVTACDSYVLPALTVGNYFTGSGGTGTPLSAGDVINSTQTIFVYEETGTMPNCTDENSFLVTINTTPVADDPADITACDSYTLPALTVGNYFTGSGGTGAALVAGNAITSTQTIYVYAQTGTTPNCTNENSFTVTINTTPAADDPADVTACDSYALPALTVGNYFTGTGGTGTALFAGNTITSSQTIYVYAQTGTMPNCTDENSFLVTINTTPVADDPADVTACDSYALPALTVGNYFTGSGGTGTALAAGNTLTSTLAIYVYAQTGTTPNCTNENSFTVTINTTPAADDPTDVTACDSYTLPALTVGNYFTGSDGTGAALVAGNAITSSQTIYVYAQTGTTPNCTDENSFLVTINTTPVADDPAEVTACDSYTLPALTVGNYFTGSGGTGTTLAAGNSLTSTQAIYVYSQTGTTPNCSDENSFLVTINTTPVADDPANVTACDSYTLPALTVGNYFTGSGGTGTALAAGNAITSTQTVFVYEETGTTPNCTDENSFLVTINTTPVADNPSDVTACDSYTLPALTVGNYYTGSGGTGTALAAGNAITSTQTIYVYAQTGTVPNCTDENSFTVTINTTPVADDPADVTACDSYVLPMLTVGNYFTGTGGTGTALFAGNTITSSQTIYVYAETGTTPNCIDENSFTVTINSYPANPANPTSNSPQCANSGVTLTRTGTPPVGETWCWQTVANGSDTGNSGSTFTVFTNGIYYIRARNTSSGCWSTSAGSLGVVVNPLPVPTITGGSFSVVGIGGNVYTTETAMTNYTWTLSGGGTITSGGGSANNTVTVTWNSAGAHTVSVNYTNTNGCRAAVANVFSVTAINPCSYNSNSASGITNITPCINYASRPLTVSSTFASNQYFTMNVINGLNYQIYSCNNPAPANQILITVYQEGEPALPYIATSILNTGNTCSALQNNSFVSFTSPITGQVRVLVNNAGDCLSVTPSGLTIIVNVNGGSNTQDNQAATATDSWIGHIYEGSNTGVAYNAPFPNYLGYFSQPETFNEGFGGRTVCFNFNSDGNVRAQVYTETFTVRYRMQSTKSGLWLANISADDGVRLAVDGTLIFNRWINQAQTSYNNMLIPLTGSSNLTLDYYENSVDNVVSFLTFRKINNNLTANTQQTACLGTPLAQITGNELLDDVNPLPAGITNTWQWVYSTTPTGSQTPIPGATLKDYTPGAPFDSPGTYYLYRKATVSSTNNASGTVAAPTFIPVTGICQSNMATINITPPSIVSVTPATRCGPGTVSLTATASEGTIEWYNVISGGTSIATGSPFEPDVTATSTFYVGTDAGSCLNSRLPVIATVEAVPNQPGTITGPTILYMPASQTYSVANTPGITYNWTFPAGWTQTGGGTSNSVTVDIPLGSSSGDITLLPSNLCGNGATRSLTVNVYRVELSVVKSDLCLSGPGNSGWITATGSNGQTPYQYRLNSGAYQASGTYSNLSAGTYTVTVRDAGGVTASTSVTLAVPPVSADDQNRAGTDSWIGHVYKRLDAVAAPPTNANAFTNYYGIIHENETFNENFGGITVCIPLEASEGIRSLSSNYFAIRFRMNSTKKGIYIADIGSDDGSRLTVDGIKVYDRWVERGWASDLRQLFNLNGNSNLLLEYYESGSNNQISFQNLLKVSNSLTSGVNQSICSGIGTLVPIAGNNAFTDAPISSTAGFTVTYKWQTASSASGPWNDISGAFAISYSPPATPTGTNFYRRILTVAKNNLSLPLGTFIPITARDTSDVSQIIVIEPTVISVQPVSPAPVCVGEPIAPLSITPVGTGHSFQWYSNTINSNSGGTLLTGEIASTFTPSSATAGTVYYYCEVTLCGVLASSTATVTVQSSPSATIVYIGNPFFYSSLTDEVVTLTGTTGGTFSTIAGLVINSSTGAITPNLSTPGDYVVTYTIAASGGCDEFSTTTNVTVAQITFSVSPVTADNICPELDQAKGFNPENGPLYNSGSTEIVFIVEILNSIAATWEFDYAIENASVSINPVSPNPQSGTIENISGNESEIHFFIVNNPGNPIAVKLVVSEVRDSESCSNNIEQEEIINISAMPELGPFE